MFSYTMNLRIVVSFEFLIGFPSKDSKRTEPLFCFGDDKIRGNYINRKLDRYVCFPKN